MHTDDEVKKIKAKGYLVIPRLDLESAIFKKPPHYLMIWLYLLNRAQYKPYKGLQKGQLHVQYKDIMQDVYWFKGSCKISLSKDQISQVLDWLRTPTESNDSPFPKTTSIATRKATTGLLITICNYESCYDVKSYESNTESNTESNEDEFRKQQQADSINKYSINTELFNTDINISFDEFWILYDKKKGDIPKLKKKWGNLSDKDRQDIIDYIPKYKEAQPEKKFRKDPDRFFNNKSWKDELINHNNNGTKKATHSNQRRSDAGATKLLGELHTELT